MKDRASEEHVTFEDFRRVIAQELQVDEDKVVRGASFVEDLFADSLKLVRLMLRMEELGIGIPLERAWEVETVGDAYRLYSESVVSGGQSVHDVLTSPVEGST
jgi:acyl carrier protein